MADGSRSLLPTVRNPLVALPAFQKLRDVLHSPAARELRIAFIEALTELRKDCAARAEKAWRQHKPPMACYWKVCSVVVGHVVRVLR